MRKFLSIMLLAAAGAACSDSTSPESIAGTYNLSTVNGESLPATVWEQDADNKTELLSATVNLNADAGTYAVSLNFRITDLGVVSQVTETDSGTWTVSGNSIIFDSADPTEDPQTATYNDGRITVVTDFDDGPVTLVFTK